MESSITPEQLDADEAICGNARAMNLSDYQGMLFAEGARLTNDEARAYSRALYALPDYIAEVRRLRKLLWEIGESEGFTVRKESKP